MTSGEPGLKGVKGELGCSGEPELSMPEVEPWLSPGGLSSNCELAVALSVEGECVRRVGKLTRLTMKSRRAAKGAWLAKDCEILNTVSLNDYREVSE